MSITAVIRMVENMQVYLCGDMRQVSVSGVVCTTTPGLGESAFPEAHLDKLAHDAA
jgi:hypothetical protein